MRTILKILELAIGLYAIVLAILLVSYPISKLPQMNRYLAAICFFSGGILVVIRNKGFIKKIKHERK